MTNSNFQQMQRRGKGEPLANGCGVSWLNSEYDLELNEGLFSACYDYATISVQIVLFNTTNFKLCEFHCIEKRALLNMLEQFCDPSTQEVDPES